MSLVMLGQTGMAISRIGLGTWAFGGSDDGWGTQDDEQSIKTIRAAVEAGINWIDTAAVYGRGRAESVIGRALAHPGVSAATVGARSPDQLTEWLSAIDYELPAEEADQLVTQ
jgi:aryl-alcohol dehydrogenase-like predicted oxidoreductase